MGLFTSTIKRGYTDEKRKEDIVRETLQFDGENEITLFENLDWSYSIIERKFIIKGTPTNEISNYLSEYFIKCGEQNLRKNCHINLYSAGMDIILYNAVIESTIYDENTKSLIITIGYDDYDINH